MSMHRTFGTLRAGTTPARPTTTVRRSRPSSLCRGYAQVNSASRTVSMRPSGALHKHKHIEVTPALGTEFPEANLTEMMNSPDADQFIKDLAITVSRRGVVFFRNQKDMTNDNQKKLLQRMGELTGKPAESGLHIHPVLNPQRALGGDDLEISTISSRQRKAFYGKHEGKASSGKRQNIEVWHSDIQSEPVPSDYTCLRLTELPTTGGDTVWASGYEVYDRLSEPLQKFLEGFTANFDAPFFKEIAQKAGLKLYDKARGHPDNIGEVLTAVHPIIRTNPITGWKSVFALGAYPKIINGLSQSESDIILEYLMNIVYKNHDLQVRFRWYNSGDMAIWDNRSTVHNATLDYDDFGERYGVRVCSIGEKPYFDPNSKSRREALALEAEESS